MSPSVSVWFEFIIYSMCLDCYYQDLPTLFETHFLNTSNCLILSASFVWAEKPGIVNMSCNYAWQEVPTKGLKRTAGVCMQLLTVSALPAQVIHCPPVWLLCLFFCLIPLSTPCFVCSHVGIILKVCDYSCTWLQVSLSLWLCPPAGLCQCV